MRKLENIDWWYEERIEEAIKGIARLLKKDYCINSRAVALLLLQEDEEILRLVEEREGDTAFQEINGIIARTREDFAAPLNYVITLQRQEKVEKLIAKHVARTMKYTGGMQEFLGRLTMHPVLGIPILFCVLYFGLYQFVGVFGAGVVVEFLERQVFSQYINPVVDSLVTTYIPWPVLQELVGRDYGIITLGLRYAIAIILPIVGTFFFVFSLIEDIGYLPRLALLVDHLFKRIGLNGRAVIPITLGFGCGTMATLVSRTLETRRERILATLLLALAVPCSAQLGVILALLSASPGALLFWAGTVAAVFLVVGYLGAKVLPGQGPSFYMEVPPLRLPSLKNILAKTFSRMQWYFVEILPMFIVASVIIWFGRVTGLFQFLIDKMAPLMALLGLPSEMATAFLFGFFRRDYGAAGLYDLRQNGSLSTAQVLVAAITLTLFVPCIAQFAVMQKERGSKTAFVIAGFVFSFAFFIGFFVHWFLSFTGIRF